VNANATESSLVRMMARWGYYLAPNRHPYAPGHHMLLIAMREIPTEMHFDPEVIQLRMGETGDSLNWSTIRLKYPLYGQRQVGLGRIIVSDRVDKRIGFFTYGAMIEAIHGHNEAVYALRSSAPILAIDPELQDFSAELAFETEVIVARSLAKWRGNESGFASRLSQLEPDRCYLAAIHCILGHYQRNRRLRDGFRLFYAALCKEVEQLAALGFWPGEMARLDDLLAPDHSAFA
jgi:hypothetical protein